MKGYRMATCRQENNKIVLEITAEESHILCVALAIYGSNTLLQQDADTALGIAQQLAQVTDTPTTTPPG